jgi:uncharacterized phage protein (TIGR01671 family)
MREIKFRVWDKKNNKYYKSIWNLMFLTGGVSFLWDDYENSDGETMITNLPKDDYELMQYTSLKDKNGKEIYEGDIIKFNWFYYGETEIEELKVGVVVWEKNTTGFSFKAKDNDNNYPFILLNFDSESDIEVIGNIYENSELIKGE